MRTGGHTVEVPALKGAPLELSVEEGIVTVRVPWGPLGFSMLVQLDALHAALAELGLPA